jgi:hypothetical protein
MESNTHSNQGPDRLAELTAAMDDLEVQDFGGLPYAVKVERVLELRRLLDLLEIQWLKELAAVDALTGPWLGVRAITWCPGRCMRELGG